VRQVSPNSILSLSLKFAAKYIVELNGIKVNSLKELIQMFIKLMDKFYITGDTLANFSTSGSFV